MSSFENKDRSTDIVDNEFRGGDEWPIQPILNRVRQLF
jgi:hypothetical protein